mmetsp:Transcript_18188/g.51805  ORF Transcript_18188/g.51805 Transcript_18188/m.51805 type:complete len:352 (-) Transcript_18188:40-1095(-)
MWPGVEAAICVQLRLGGRQLHIGEVDVLHRAPRGDAPRRVVHHALLQDVDAVGAHLRPRVPDVLPALVLPLREAGLELWQLVDLRPVRHRGGPELLEDLEDRVDLGVPREQRRARRHLRDDAADAPHVHGHAVELRAHEDLGRAIPHGDDLVRVLRHRHGVRSRQAEVGEFQPQLRVDQQVLRLQVAMQDAVGVAELGSPAELERHRLDDLRVQVLPAEPAHVLLQVLLHELENKHELLSRAKDVQQLDYVLVVELPQQRDLADGGAWDALLLRVQLHLLHGDVLAVAHVLGLVDPAVGPLPKQGLLRDHIIIQLELALNVVNRLFILRRRRVPGEHRSVVPRGGDGADVA